MNVRNIYKFGTMAAILAAVHGCGNSFLDTGLDLNDTPETVETNRGTIASFANACYARIPQGFYRIDENLFAAVTDEAQQTRTSGDVYYFTKGTVNANVNPISYLYDNYYDGIRACNFFLDYVADGKGEALLALNRDIEGTEKVSYERDIENLGYRIGEAYIVKAYYYSELIKMYGGVPIIEETLEQAGDKKVARSDYDAVVSYITKLIDDHVDELAVDWSENTDRGGRFTQGSALAIKARTLLYAASPLHNPSNDKAKWIAAAQAAHDIIDHPDLGYSLAPDYRNYFTGANPLTSNETIYAVRSGTSNAPESKNYPIATYGGNSGVTPTHNLVSAYEYTGTPDPDDPYANRDPRLTATVVTNGSVWNDRVIDESPGGYDDMTVLNASRTGYYLKKFLTDDLNLTQGQTAQHNWVAYRYGEVLLNYAEAMNEAYGPDNAPAPFTMTAREALQMVRDRASTSLPAVTANGIPAFRDAVKHERRIELAFEDHRYWDLLRWEDAMTVLNQPVTGVVVTKTASGDYQYEVRNVGTRTFYERNYYLPFQRSEVVNSGGTLQQNEGYE